MILKMKNGDVKSANLPFLLDYLGIKKEAAGIVKVFGNVELIASVPFRLAADVETESGFPWTLSTFDLDRYAERIDPAGWDFSRYLDNPVVEWAHRYDLAKSVETTGTETKQELNLSTFWNGLINTL